jgi:hypothetical protein
MEIMQSSAGAIDLNIALSESEKGLELKWNSILFILRIMGIFFILRGRERRERERERGSYRERYREICLKYICFII